MIKKLFLLLFIAIGFTASAQTAEELFDKGCGYLADGNYTKAVECFQKAAEQGYASAQYNLGNSYYKGEGVPQNYTEAVKWYRKAAEQGDAEAQYNLALCYGKGEGVTENFSESIKWLKKAAAQGYSGAINILKQLGEM